MPLLDRHMIWPVAILTWALFGLRVTFVLGRKR